MNQFMNQFCFDTNKSGFLGVEREAFLLNASGTVVPRAKEVLESLRSNAFSYELSACQIESKVGPHRLSELEQQLTDTEQILLKCLEEADLSLLHSEVGPDDMPLDVYPDPSGRYQRITATMPHAVLKAACQAIGTHIHVGMPDHETALRVYNHATSKYTRLCALGNGSFGERLEIYKIVAPDCDPMPYEDWKHFERVAKKKNFDSDPRRCWTLIRISRYGTIEFRMFGATGSIPRIMRWATTCHNLCTEVM